MNNYGDIAVDIFNIEKKLTVNRATVHFSRLYHAFFLSNNHGDNLIETQLLKYVIAKFGFSNLIVAFSKQQNLRQKVRGSALIFQSKIYRIFHSFVPPLLTILRSPDASSVIVTSSSIAPS